MNSQHITVNWQGQVKKVLWITIFWIIVSALQYSNGYATLLYFNYDFGQINTHQFLLGSLVTGMTAGIVGGSCMVFFWERWLRSKSYSQSLIFILLSYSSIYLLVTILSLLYSYSVQLNEAPFSNEVLGKIIESVWSLSVLYGYFFWLLVVIITLIALLVNDKYGPGVFADFLLGKYFRPRKEARIFMFLDLRGSTTIAEKLGEEQYFSFLKEVYTDMTPAILTTEGEVYQYVGDEIVLCWKPRIGRKDANVIRCFYLIEQALYNRSSHYDAEYAGIQPRFKAGLHYGNVMAGEIGVLKREIAYSGDVLNTAARIQSKCNDLGVDILISENLVELMRPFFNKFQPELMGSYPLRGKSSQIQLYTLTH